ncbi:MAG: hypothetical protein AB4352_21835 [Hormoscilla sp.]
MTELQVYRMYACSDRGGRGYPPCYYFPRESKITCIAQIKAIDATKITEGSDPTRNPERLVAVEGSRTSVRQLLKFRTL